MTQLSRRHELTAAILVDDEFDADECRGAMQGYCHEVVLVPNPCDRLPNDCCSFGPWPQFGASSGCGSQCQRCSTALIGSCAPGDSMLSTLSSRTLATTPCAKLRLARGCPR